MKDLLPRHSNFYRPSKLACRKGGERDVRTDMEFAAKATTDIFTDNSNIFPSEFSGYPRHFLALP